MKIPVWVLRVGQAEPEKHTIEAEAADYSDAALRAFVHRILNEQRDTHPEHVHVLFNGARRSMFVDEFGSGVYGRDPLPVNDAATEIYWAASRARGLDPAKEPNPSRIHGLAVLFPDHHVWS